MNKIEWNESLSIGIDLIDEQHRTWIRHYNDVVEAINAGHGQEQVMNTLAFLSGYTNEHFASEEEQMMVHAYPRMANHIAIHNSLKGTVKELIRDFRDDGVSPGLATAIETLLGNWLVKHITSIDKEFGQYIHDNNPTQA